MLIIFSNANSTDHMMKPEGMLGVRARAENVLNLKGCIEGVQETLRKGDFEASAKFVSNFKEVEKLISVEGEDYRVMVKAEKVYRNRRLIYGIS